MSYFFAVTRARGSSVADQRKSGSVSNRYPMGSESSGTTMWKSLSFWSKSQRCVWKISHGRSRSQAYFRTLHNLCTSTGLGALTAAHVHNVGGISRNVWELERCSTWKDRIPNFNDYVYSVRHMKLQPWTLICNIILSLENCSYKSLFSLSNTDPCVCYFFVVSFQQGTNNTFYTCTRTINLPTAAACVETRSRES